MRMFTRTRTLIIAGILAITVFLNATTGRETTDEDDVEPPLDYDDSVIALVTDDKQAKAGDHIKEQRRLADVANSERIERERLAKLEEERLAEIARIEKAKQAEATRIANAVIAEKKRKEAEKVVEEQRKAVANKVAKVEQPKATAKPQSEQPTPSRSQGYVGKAQTYETTYYSAFCNTGCTGVTASGYNVANTIYYDGMRILAAPSNIPLYSILRVTSSNGSSFDGIVLDRGGDIGAGRLDILVGSVEEARSNGRHSVSISIIRRGR